MTTTINVYDLGSDSLNVFSLFNFCRKRGCRVPRLLANEIESPSGFKQSESVKEIAQGIQASELSAILILADFKEMLHEGELPVKPFSLTDNVDIRDPDLFYSSILENKFDTYSLRLYVIRIMEIAKERLAGNKSFGHPNHNGEVNLYPNRFGDERGMFFADVKSMAIGSGSRKEKARKDEVSDREFKRIEELVKYSQAMSNRYGTD